MNINKQDQEDLDDQDSKEGEIGAHVQKFTNWANEPTIRDLKQDFEDANPGHKDQVSKIEVYLDNLNMTGAAKMKPRKGQSTIQPKLIRKQAEWRYAALSEPFLSTDDVFNVSPITYEDKKAAEQNQLVLNNQFNTKIDKIRFIDEYVRTNVDEGTAIIKVGWDFKEESVTEIVPKYEYQIVEGDEVIARHQELAALKQQDEALYKTNTSSEWQQAHDMAMERGLPIVPVQVGKEEVTKFKVICNKPTLEICKTGNVVIDPTAEGDIRKANFVIHSFESSMAELKKDGKYKNLENLNQINVTGGSPLNEPDHVNIKDIGNFNFSDKPRTKILVREYWGFWDINKDGILKPIVAAWVGNVMIRMDLNPFPDKEIPFVVVQYLPVRKANHGEPDGVLIEDNQKVVGAVMRGMVDLMGKSANAQTGFRKDMLDITNRSKFNAGEDYEFNGQGSPDNGIFMHKYPEIPASAQIMLQLQNQEAESLTGVKSFSQGVSGSSLGEVAAGVRGALDAASKRELGILRRLSAGIIEIGRKFISMNAEFLSELEVVRITNDKFVQVRRDDLPGNFDLKLTISTAEEDNNKAQELAFMLQTMGNNMDPAMSRMLLSDIAKLRKMPDLAKKIEEYVPQPDPMAVKKAELEIALLEAQIATEQAKAVQLGANAQLAGAKIGTEGAKTEHLNADKDLKNLDFVEQESGVKQERDLQKQGAQAKANAQLKVLEFALTPEEKKTGK